MQVKVSQRAARRGRRTQPSVVSNRYSVFVIAGIYACAEALHFRINTVTQLAFAACLAVMCFVTAFLTPVFHRVALTVAIGVLSYSLFYSQPWIFGDKPNSWLLGDALTLVVIAVAIVASTSATGSGGRLDAEQDRRVQSVVLFLGLLSMGIAGLLGTTQFTGIVRFRPPTTLLIAFLGLYLFRHIRSRSSFGVLHLGAWGVVTAFALFSGFRTSLLQIGVTVVLVLFFSLRNGQSARFVARSLVLLTLIISIGLTATGPAPVFQAVESIAASSRLDLLGSSGGGLDESTLGRFVEASETFDALTSERGSIGVLVGAGNGAYYVPTDANTRHAADGEGRFHAVHLGPVRVIFRYGLIGLVAHLGFLGLIFKRHWSPAQLGAEESVLALLLVAVIGIDFLAFNPLNQFHNGVIAGWLIGSLIRRVPQKDTQAVFPTPIDLRRRLSPR